MALQVYQVQELKGLVTNPALGLSDQPTRLYNLYTEDRLGGLTAFGSISTTSKDARFVKANLKGWDGYGYATFFDGTSHHVSDRWTINTNPTALFTTYTLQSPAGWTVAQLQAALRNGTVHVPTLGAYTFFTDVAGYDIGGNFFSGAATTPSEFLTFTTSTGGSLNTTGLTFFCVLMRRTKVGWVATGSFFKSVLPPPIDGKVTIDKASGFTFPPNSKALVYVRRTIQESIFGRAYHKWAVVGEIAGTDPEPLILGAYPDIERLLYLPAFSGQTVVHRGRVVGFAGTFPWWSITSDIFLFSGDIFTSIYDAPDSLSNSIIWTDPYSFNFSYDGNFLGFTSLLQSSAQLTGLASLPGGLVVFAENEAFLVTGNMDESQVIQVQRFPLPIGCDVGVTPCVWSTRAFTIWKGKLYSVDTGGGVEDVGLPIYNHQDPFHSVWVDDLSQDLIVRTTAGKIFRRSMHQQGWVNNVIEDVSPTDSGKFILPARTGVLYFDGTVIKELFRGASTPSTQPQLAIGPIDCKQPDLEKQFLYVEVHIDNLPSNQNPTLEIDVDGTVRSGIVPRRIGSKLVYALPGLLGKYIKMTFTAPSFANDTVWRPPVNIYYLPRRRRM